MTTTSDISRRRLLTVGSLVAAGASVLPRGVLAAPAPVTILNVSYDPTREFYKEFDTAFASYWLKNTGQVVTINQSHGGSGKQARSVIDGLEADVVTLALAADIDAISGRANLLPANWQSRLPFNSTPYSSTIVFLVRKGNPKGVHDWGDLIKPGVSSIAPNPKTGGGARWVYLAAWAWAQKKGGSQAAAQDYVQKLYRTIPVLDTGSRGSTVTFAQRGLGDVLLGWENEAFLALDEFGADKFEIVYPSLSILAEPPVALVDKIVDRHNTRVVSTGYLNFLYSPIGQDLVGKHHFRPRNPKAVAKYAATFKPIQMVTIDKTFGGWTKAQATHFADGGIFDRIYKPA
jgi:sulfate/thiosulfate-binding protein